MRLLAVESYSGKGVEDEQGDIVFSREMSSIAKNMGGKILLCDDLSDTGITLNKSVDWLKKYEPIKDKIEDIKTATLWKKKKSTFEPDYCAVKLKNDPWIVQPFEHYEEIRIEEIKKNIKKRVKTKFNPFSLKINYSKLKSLKHLSTATTQIAGDVFAAFPLRIFISA